MNQLLSCKLQSHTERGPLLDMQQKAPAQGKPQHNEKHSINVSGISVLHLQQVIQEE